MNTESAILEARPVAASVRPLIRVLHLYTSPGHNFIGHHGRPPDTHPTIEVDQIECVACRGIRGDRYFDHERNYRGQITFFSAEVFSVFQRELHLPQASPAATRRNVITEGINLNTLIGADFEIQGVRFAGVEECRPCYWMNHAFGHELAEAWLRGNGGLRARILTDGVVRTSRLEDCANGTKTLTCRSGVAAIAQPTSYGGGVGWSSRDLTQSTPFSLR